MNTLKPKINLHAAVFLVVSAIIGSGVFKKIAPMAEALGSPFWIIACWVFAGLISLAGALSTAELVSLFPNSGGEYHYFQKIYSRFFAFLYGWACFIVIKTATIAALAYVFAQSFNSLIGLPNWENDLSIKALAGTLVILLTFLNSRGVGSAEKFSRILTYGMFIGVSTLILWGAFSSQGSIQHFEASKELTGWDFIKAFTTASLGAFWGYEGWNNIGYIGEEVEQPRKNLPKALAFGTILVISAYVLLNLVFVYVLPIDFFIQLNQTPNRIAAVEVAKTLGGDGGMLLVAGLILTTTLNATNSTILMSARMVFAMSRDNLFFKFGQSVHPKYNTPNAALWLQAFWVVVLIFSGSFDQLTNLLVFASFLFYGSSALGVIIMRKKASDLERTYKVWGYPFVPFLFIIVCLAMLCMTFINQPKEALIGLALIATGLPLYWYLNRGK